ncbi:MAG: nucleotidyltransferase [Alphaproteobacteria bacterium]|jgi:predicted nucleotidyltransferase|nr:nucleotidyltransferase [Alphaproteobacteria bacterium]
MIDRDEVIATLQAHRAELEQRGVRHAAVFGSVARGNAGPASDIDILIDLDPSTPIDMYAYCGLKHLIADYFPVSVDVIDRAALKKELRGKAESDAYYAF